MDLGDLSLALTLEVHLFLILLLLVSDNTKENRCPTFILPREAIPSCSVLMFDSPL